MVRYRRTFSKTAFPLIVRLHGLFGRADLCTGRFAKSLASLAERAHGLRTVDLPHEQPDFNWNKQDALARRLWTEQDRPLLSGGPAAREPVDSLEKPSFARHLGLLIKSYQGK